MEYPRLLVISRNAWNTTNSTGNTLNNLFSQWDKKKVANIFCRAEIPQNDICNKYYQITEKDLIKNIIKKTKVGKSYNGKKLDFNSKTIQQEKWIYNFFKIYRFSIFLFAREVLWKMSKWKNDNLNLFLTEFSPDIIYMHIHDSFYMHDILKFAKDITNARVVLFFADDTCSYKQFSFSPFYWLRRILFKRKIKLSLQITDKVYGASEKLCNEYSKLFNRDIELLYKCGYFTKNRVVKTKCSTPLKLTYAGNIFYNRWKILSIIAKELHKINEKGIKAQFYIYTHNNITKKIDKSININGTSYVMGGIPYKEIKEVLSRSDIVIHVEALNIKNMLSTRLSFSTKLVDYFQSARCIFAVGWEKSASIDYLIKNDAAVVATDVKGIEIKLKNLIDNPDIINKYGKNAWECGRKNHRIEVIQEMLRTDLNNLVHK